MSEYHYTNCKWLDANHFLFQIANVCLAVSYLAPDSLNGLFMLRAALGLGGLFFALWGWWVLCAPDTFVWNLLFMIFNFGHLAYMYYKIKKPRRFSEEAESVYQQLFEPLGVERYQFQKFANLSSVLKLSAREVYGKEGSTVHRISVLLTGGVEAVRAGAVLHTISEFEFLDSPEWATFRAGQVSRYGVSLITTEDCTFLTWDSFELRRKLASDPLMKNVFNSLIGQDVTGKLLHLDQTFEGAAPLEGNMISTVKRGYLEGYINGNETSQLQMTENEVSTGEMHTERIPLLKKTSISSPGNQKVERADEAV